MKRLLFCLLTIITVFVLSCTKKDTQDTSVPDPAGTITTNLSVTSDLILCQTGPTHYGTGTIRLGMNVPAVTDWIYFNDGYNNSMNKGETADIGQVHGLGNVTEKPTAGFTFNAALIKGEGYVIRYKEDINYANSTLPYSYGRFYVVDYQLDALGEIMGVTIKYQGPF